MATKERDKPAWDNAKIVPEEDNRLPSLPILYLKILLRLLGGLAFFFAIITLSTVQMTSFAYLVMQEGLHPIHILKEKGNLSEAEMQLCLNKPWYHLNDFISRSGILTADICSNYRSILSLNSFMEYYIGDGIPEIPEDLIDLITVSGFSYFAVAGCLIFPEVRGFVINVYFLIFRHKELKNSTKTKNALIFATEIINGAALSVLVFLVMPNLALFEASILPYMCIAGPLVISLIYKSSLHPGGWPGFAVDLFGIMLLIGTFTLIGFEHYFFVKASFVWKYDYYTVPGMFAILVFGYNTFNNYQRKSPSKKEEGLYWAHVLSAVFRISIYIGALIIALDMRVLDDDTKQLLDEAQTYDAIEKLNITYEEVKANLSQYSNSSLLYDPTIDYLNIDYTYFFTMRFSDHTPFHGMGTALDYATIICILSTFLLSYLSITAVRLQYQLVGMVLPQYTGMILVGVYFFLLPFLEENEGQVTLLYIPWGDEVILYRFGLQIGAAICAYIAFIIATRHVWFDRCYPYALERTLFDTALYRGAFTSLQLMVNRKRNDLAKHIAYSKKKQDNNRMFKGFIGLEAMTGVVVPDLAISRKDREDRKNSTKASETKPMIFICTTLWHEEDNEMTTLITSLLRLIHYVNQRRRDPYLGPEDLFNLEINIFFDNVFDDHTSVGENASKPPQWLPKGYQNWQTLNKYVKSFGRIFGQCLMDTDQKSVLENAKTILTPYGGRLEYDVDGLKFLVHLKHADRVQKGKRWSMVMYLYYLIGYKIDTCNMTCFGDKVAKENSFVLALDGDVDFEPEAVELVLDRMRRNKNVGACCNQIHPQGSGYLVWYQRFEYAVGHWLQKATEHVLGCVLCSPGCFSMMRMSFLSMDNVMAKYRSIAQSPLQKLMYDQGEDRWLCTLILLAGGRIEFEAAAHCLTYAPEDLATFYKQRRRWGPSTTANIWELIVNRAKAVKANSYISNGYVLYQFLIMIFSLIGLSTTVLMVAEAFMMATPGLDQIVGYIIVIGPVVTYAFLCRLYNDGDTQLKLAAVFSLLYSAVMALVLIAIVKAAVECPVNLTFLFFVSVACIYIVTGVLHFDFVTLLCGIIYWLLIPSGFIFLQIYSIANLNDVSWGTRSGGTSSSKRKIRKKKKAVGFVAKVKEFVMGPEYIEQEIEENKEDDDFQKEEEAPDEPQEPDLDLDTIKAGENIESIEQLYGGIHPMALRKQTKLWDFGKQSIALAQPTFIKQLEPIDRSDNVKVNVIKREFQNIKDYELNYFSWALDARAPIHAKSKIYTLSSSEHDFWIKMVDKVTGHIRNQLRSEDAAQQARIAEENAEQLTELRDKLFFAYLFINVLWLIISVAVKQADIKIQLPSEWKLPDACYTGAPPNDTSTIVDEDPYEIEPLSLFFLIFYIVVMTIQFMTMLWHRMSTFQHYLAYLDIPYILKLIQRTKETIRDIKAQKVGGKPQKSYEAVIFQADTITAKMKSKKIRKLWLKAYRYAKNPDLAGQPDTDSTFGDFAMGALEIAIANARLERVRAEARAKDEELARKAAEAQKEEDGDEDKKKKGGFNLLGGLSEGFGSRQADMVSTDLRILERKVDTMLTLLQGPGPGMTMAYGAGYVTGSQPLYGGQYGGQVLNTSQVLSGSENLNASQQPQVIVQHVAVPVPDTTTQAVIADTSVKFAESVKSVASSASSDNVSRVVVPLSSKYPIPISSQSPQTRSRNSSSSSSDSYDAPVPYADSNPLPRVKRADTLDKIFLTQEVVRENPMYSEAPPQPVLAPVGTNFSSGNVKKRAPPPPKPVVQSTDWKKRLPRLSVNSTDFNDRRPSASTSISHSIRDIVKQNHKVEEAIVKRIDTSSSEPIVKGLYND